jgi:hypothetical protein
MVGMAALKAPPPLSTCPLWVYVSQPKELVDSKAYHMVIIAKIPMKIIGIKL